MIDYADFLFCNKFEAIACSKYFHKELGIEWSEDDTYENLTNIAKAIANYNLSSITRSRPRIMIITNSGEPVVCSISEFRDQPQISFTQDVIDIEKSKLLDSNSAGDSFVGGFLARLNIIIETRKADNNDSTIFSKMELREAIHAGNLMACEVLQQYGCTFPSPEKFRALLQEKPFNKDAYSSDAQE